MVFKIQNQKKPNKLAYQLTEEMAASFHESFSGDYNMIVEEFEFYQQLPPKMQSELVEYIFPEVMLKFQHLFNFCEKGFRNELLVQMYSRRV